MSLKAILCGLLILSGAFMRAQSAEIYLRVNQLGYLPAETKVALALTTTAHTGNFYLTDASDNTKVFTIKPKASTRTAWAPFADYYELDFSDFQTTGRYYLTDGQGRGRSPVFPIGPDLYRSAPGDLLAFMRQQRCGYNPFLDQVCHQKDGRSMYGTSLWPDSSFVDLSGGWHDAGDQLKYLITGSYATAHMLLAFELYPAAFSSDDQVNALGQGRPNSIPDVLDEAKWGLDWIMKLHPAPDVLYHQVADDRDHIGWKMPDEDPSDYGWGPNSYRVGYVADGQPQGLRKFKSKATGVANLAGRSAAALALAARIWEHTLQDSALSAQYLRAARSVYALGRAREGYQQGNSYSAPYRYNEDTWADDMEWGAAELYKATGERHYLDEAKQYARMAGTTSWMPLDTAEHYRYYPFVNLGHFALYEVVDAAFRDTLAGFYRAGLQHTLQRGNRNPYRIGVPFIWCSNNLATALITQGILYEKMTGDQQFHDFILAQRDWLLGRNPWGTSMFTGLPRAGEYPQDVHTSVYVLTKRMVPGGLVDGPVYASVFQHQKGLALLEPDEFAAFQNDIVVYHDDIGDYSTNEPTMDGTAGAMIMMGYWANW